MTLLISDVIIYSDDPDNDVRSVTLVFRDAPGVGVRVTFKVGMLHVIVAAPRDVYVSGVITRSASIGDPAFFRKSYLELKSQKMPNRRIL